MAQLRVPRCRDEAVVLARTPVCVQAYRVGPAAWGIQFHAEVTAADARSWIDDYHSDEDAVRIGVDPSGLRAETEGRSKPSTGSGASSAAVGRPPALESQRLSRARPSLAASPRQRGLAAAVDLSSRSIALAARLASLAM